MKLATHLVVLLAAVLAQNKKIMSWRHIGTGFHIGSNGTIATCSHIIGSRKENEVLLALEASEQNLVFPLYDIKCHPSYDFAIAKIENPNPIQFPTIYSGETLYVGDDVLAFSYFGVGGGGPGSVPNLQGRLFKGHIVSIHPREIHQVSPTTCELSFPSISGFSGAPLLHERDCILGMLHGNLESSIEVYKYEEVVAPSSKHAESIHRVIELGLAHTAMDIRGFLKDLGVTDIPDGPSEAQLNIRISF